MEENLETELAEKKIDFKKKKNKTINLQMVEKLVNSLVTH